MRSRSFASTGVVRNANEVEVTIAATVSHGRPAWWAEGVRWKYFACSEASYGEPYASSDASPRKSARHGTRDLQ